MKLQAASYSTTADARADFYRLHKGHRCDGLLVEGVVMGRGHDGNVDLYEPLIDSADPAAWFEVSVGVAVGLFAPALLLASALSSGAGAAVAQLVRRHEKRWPRMSLDRRFPLSSSVVLFLGEEDSLRHARSKLANAGRFLYQPVETMEYRRLRSILNHSARRRLLF